MPTDQPVSPGNSFNPNAEVAVTAAVGSTGHWPVPSGDPPLGTGRAPELSQASVSTANVPPVPSGQWPDGTGGSPVLPVSISAFGLKSFAVVHRWFGIKENSAQRHGVAPDFVESELGGFVVGIDEVFAAGEMETGSTGDPPVPSGHWPDGTGGTLAVETDA